MFRFNINDYDSSYVMHCKSLEEAEQFTKYLHSIGECWCSGSSYLDYTNWSSLDGGTCYRFIAGSYDTLKSYIDGKAKKLLGIINILEFDNFEWEEESTQEQNISYEDVMLFS